MPSRWLGVLLVPTLSMGQPSCSPEATTPAAESAGSLVASTPMLSPRALHTTTLLRDGRVLIVGGGSPETAIANAELLDLEQRSSRLIAMAHGRVGHTATLLPNGTVLIVGGGYGADAGASVTAELFDPASGTFRNTGRPSHARTDHAAILLSSGQVLIAGGDASGVGSAPTATAELYDPLTESFTRTGPMSVARRPYGITALPNGTVLVAGGTSTAKSIVGSAELYDVASGQFRPTGSLHGARQKHAAALIGNDVLIVGGSTGDEVADRLTTTERFAIGTGAFSAGPSLTTARHKVAAALLDDGSVLVAGGGANLAELYDAKRQRFIEVSGGAGIERLYPSVTPLPGGKALISGGYTRGGSQRDTWILRR